MHEGFGLVAFTSEASEEWSPAPLGADDYVSALALWAQHRRLTEACAYQSSDFNTKPPVAWRGTQSGQEDCPLLGRSDSSGKLGSTLQES